MEIVAGSSPIEASISKHYSVVEYTQKVQVHCVEKLHMRDHDAVWSHCHEFFST